MSLATALENALNEAMLRMGCGSDPQTDGKWYRIECRVQFRVSAGVWNTVWRREEYTGTRADYGRRMSAGILSEAVLKPCETKPAELFEAENIERCIEDSVR